MNGIRTETARFHGGIDLEELTLGRSPGQIDWSGYVAPLLVRTVSRRELSYRFHLHTHPWTRELMARLTHRSLPGLLGADVEYRRLPDGSLEEMDDGRPRPVLHRPLFSPVRYEPTGVVETPFPVHDVDFSTSGAYSVYNWELFYHVPLTVGIHLSRNGRFEAAQRWFHYIFDPTDDGDLPTPDRYWRVRPFQFSQVERIQDILVNLASGEDPELRQTTLNALAAWGRNPFRPHVVARYRHSAYRMKAFTAYLDNLIAWGDDLFRQDTRESINEATQLYVMAANLLGPRPRPVPSRGRVRAESYASLRSDLDAFGNALRELEAEIPFDLGPLPGDVHPDSPHPALRSLGQSLYFCIPRNDKLLAYWDTVADRLFKIRNSLNLQGIFRQLPLFDPPIDPGMLAAAAAAGLDVGAVVAGTNQPLPLVRYRALARQAREIAGEVKSLGSGLLAAMKGEDGERLALLQARHTRTILGMADAIRYGRWQEAIKAREALEHSLGAAAARYIHHERLLGRDVDEIEVPELEGLDRAALEELRSRDTEPELPIREFDPAAMRRAETKAARAGETAKDLKIAAGTASVVAPPLSLIPEFGVKIQPLGAGGDIKIGGKHFSKFAEYTAKVLKFAAEVKEFEAKGAEKVAEKYERQGGWTLSSINAAGELNITYRQLRAAQIREAVAEMEWRLHQQEMAHAEDIESFLTDERKGKLTGKGFHTWMKREVRGLYTRCLDLAHDVARKAERALQHELGDPEISYLKPAYSTGREGLLAGEKLTLDLLRMDAAYHDLNRREYELSTDFSLLQIAPWELVRLRETGRCTVSIPEALFDLAAPGHYFRRIRTVALSIPSEAGAQAGIHCTLTLLKSSVRRSPLLRDGAYPREDAEDPRFSDHFGRVQSIVTSTTDRDQGLFEARSGDERTLPFEYSGAVSEWQLELPAALRRFDYGSIRDVVLHMDYTAREGGALLRRGAETELERLIDEADGAGSLRLFSVAAEFPDAWQAFQASAPSAAGFVPLTLELTPEHYPYWSRGRLGALHRIDLLARTDAPVVRIAGGPDGGGGSDDLEPDPEMGGLRAGRLDEVPLPAPVGSWTIHLDTSALEDLWILVRWGGEV
jgi:hypothetical protein